MSKKIREMMQIQKRSNYRVEICGGIASGKTTLATLLKRLDIHPIFEDFQQSPFLTAFYSAPQKYSFETEVTFLLQHYHQIKIADSASNLVCDYSLYLDMAYAAVTLTSTQLETFRVVYQEVRNEIFAPNLLINLECDASIELKRIHNRKRPFEQNIDIHFLEKLNQAIGIVVEAYKTDVPILEINSVDINFANNEKDKDYVVNLIKSKLSDL